MATDQEKTIRLVVKLLWELCKELHIDLEDLVGECRPTATETAEADKRKEFFQAQARGEVTVQDETEAEKI